MKLPPIVLDCLRGAAGGALALAVGCGQPAASPPGVPVNAPSPGAPTVQTGPAPTSKPPETPSLPAAQLTPAPPVAAVAPTPAPTPPEVTPAPAELAQQPAKRPRRRRIATQPDTDPGIGIGHFPVGVNPACGRG